MKVQIKLSSEELEMVKSVIRKRDTKEFFLKVGNNRTTLRLLISIKEGQYFYRAYIHPIGSVELPQVEDLIKDYNSKN